MVFRPDAAQAQELSHALSSASRLDCLKIVTKILSRSRSDVGQKMGERFQDIKDRLLARRQPALTEQLAHEIIEYGRMKAAGPGDILIEVPDLAFRLRESPRDVRQSLRLLEKKGIAKETRSKDHWELTG